MVLRNQLERVQTVYREYPGQFWILILGTFIDRLGGALIYPFFTLYITRRFNMGMTEVGLVFGVFSVSSIVGSTFGGALTDRLGRKAMLIFGLVTSASATLMMGLANSLGFFLASTLLVGLLAHSGGPAQQAMVADLLPPGPLVAVKLTPSPVVVECSGARLVRAEARDAAGRPAAEPVEYHFELTPAIGE